MASGTADRLDVTAWIPSARTAPAARSSWEAAGVASRSGTSSQDRFGAALSAARAEDDAAAVRTRTANRRDDREAVQDRQATQRDQAEASRATTERARDAAVQADARAEDRRASIAKPTASAAARPQGAAQAQDRPAPSGAIADKKATAATQTGKVDRTAPQPRDAAEAARDGAPDPGAAATQDAGQTDPAVPPAQADATASPQQADPAAQPANSDPTATLLALLATLAEGAPVRAAGIPGDETGSGKDGAAGDGTVVAAKSGSGAAAPAPALPGPPGAGSVGEAPAALGAVSGNGRATADARSSAAAATLGQAGKIAAAGDAAPAAAGDPAAAAAASDFLAALADTGQGGVSATPQNPAGGQPQGPMPAPQGGPTLAPSAGTSAAGHAAAAPPAGMSAAADPAIPIGQVPMAIGLRSLGGSNAFQIRLDPVELGRIDVKLEIDKARGTVMTHLVVDRPETLAMLQRDAGQLQQALSQTGLDPSGGGLNLSLRSDGSAQGGGGGQQDNAPRGGATSWTRDQAEPPQDITPTRWLRGYGGVDIRI
ncbi:flagellar hook-length control protein FliK [Methylobacterium sp. J-070]|uniref:flagellar hook-length control protein FliK n=1 Tax=Methylobacterium sp. J-070 TaxID=2836650 RepID=UPI001FBB3609|nr:flagellar hook-length control protein FliK [Methylobacterium sp. J-070]MCJ2054551.1 flagellar hook-length control protein FliK [Methylobacterium sp. J-070]